MTKVEYIHSLLERESNHEVVADIKIVEILELVAEFLDTGDMFKFLGEMKGYPTSKDYSYLDCPDIYHDEMILDKKLKELDNK